MSLTLAGALLGFAGSALPEVFGYFKDKNEKKKAIEEQKIQADLMRERADINLEMFHAKAGDAEHERLLAHDETLTADKGVFGALRKSVRPVVTYSFFGLFAYIKWSVLQEALTLEDAEMIDALQLVWDAETKAMFGAVMAFWFGDRAITKYKRRT